MTRNLKTGHSGNLTQLVYNFLSHLYNYPAHSIVDIERKNKKKKKKKLVTRNIQLSSLNRPNQDRNPHMSKIRPELKKHMWLKLFSVVFNVEKGLLWGVYHISTKKIWCKFSVLHNKQPLFVSLLSFFFFFFLSSSSVQCGNQTQPIYIFLWLFTTIPRIIYR